ETDEMNCLNYDYKLDIEMIQGTKTPAKGMLALGPGSLGFSVFGSMETSLSGAEKKFSTGSSAGMSTDAIDLEKLTPGLLQKLGAKPELNPAPKGEFFHVDDYVFDSQNQPYELGVVDGGSGQLGVKISASGFQLLGPVPNVGWVLLTLQKTGALDAGFLLQGSAGVRGIYSYKTLFPHNLEHETGDGSYVIIVDGDEGNSVTRQLRRSFVGGLESDADTTIKNSTEVQGGMNTKLEKLKSDMGVTDVSSKIVQIAFNLGAGIYVSALGGMTGAEAKIELAGDNGWTDQPSLEITINANGDSPVIKEINGDVRATTDLYMKAWIAKLQKQYVWGSIPIKHEFSTETVFAINPISVTIDETNREDYDISTFNGSPENVVNDFLVIGDYSCDSTGSGAIAYTDMETKGGDMRLMTSNYNSEDIWGTPVCISKTGGAIISHDIIKLPGNNTYMAVWSEITAENVDKTCPPSVLKYSVGNIVGGEWEWSVPTACVNLDEVATHVELLPNGGQISLVYMSTDEGPQGVNYQVSGLNWNGSSWGTTARLIERSRISGFTSCGTDDQTVSPVLIAYVDDEHNLKTLGWSSNGVSEATLLKEESGNDLALVNDSDGDVYLAYSVLGQGIGLYSYANGQWHDQGIPFTDALPNQLNMQLLPSDELLLGWTDISGDGAGYGIVSQDGMVISDTHTLTSANSGKYYGVSLVEAQSDDNEAVYLFVLNENEDVDLNAYLIESNDTRPVLSGTVSISGIPTVGKTLTADISGLTNQSGILSYQWKRGGTRIEGATAASYVLAEADTGYTITVVVASSDNSGTVTSAATAEISATGGGLSNLADLSSLSLSVGTLSPAFSASTLSYTASVANSVNTIRVTASVYDSSATLLINGTELQSGAESGNIELNMGENTITVKVTGTDQAVKTYVITVTRAEEDECFIATAAFGSKFSWPVSLLRQFRDQYLLSNDLGRSFVRFYYHNSPPLADYIAGSEGLRLLVRVLLAPVIGLVYILYHPLWAVLAVGVGLLFFKKKRVIITGI
ncbi:MAG: cell wall/surface repeat protein, partial [Firmicutes bacterium]|nr:cell wall/surface repeat protein [Bacillota bacterium]